MGGPRLIAPGLIEPSVVDRRGHSTERLSGRGLPSEMCADEIFDGRA